MNWNTAYVNVLVVAFEPEGEFADCDIFAEVVTSDPLVSNPNEASEQQHLPQSLQRYLVLIDRLKLHIMLLQ